MSLGLFAQTNFEASLRLYLNFNNNSLSDRSPNNHGFVNHNVDFEEGIDDEGLLLNGINAYLEIPPALSLEIKETLTTSVWYKHEDQTTSAFYSLVEQSADELGGHSRYGSWVFGQNKVMACIEPDVCTNGAQVCQRCIAGSALLEEGKWYHIASTYDGGTLTIYVNGQISGQRTYASQTGISTRSYPLTIGTDVYDPAPVYLKGVLDEIRIYDRAFSEEEIIELYDSFRMTTSTFNIATSSFYYYPNPATTVLNLKTSHQNEPYKIVNSFGQILQKGQLNVNQTIDVSNLNEGFYFLQYGEGVQRVVKPLVIK